MFAVLAPKGDALGAPGAPGFCVLRPHQAGDMGWVVHRHGVLYARELLYAAGYVAMCFVTLALITVILTKPRRAAAPAG